MERLDIRGKVCPYPTTEVLEAVNRLAAGGKLEVVSDYLPARYTIPALVADLQCSYDMRDNDDGTFTIFIEKAATTSVA